MDSDARPDIWQSYGNFLLFYGITYLKYTELHLINLQVILEICIWKAFEIKYEMSGGVMRCLFSLLLLYESRLAKPSRSLFASGTHWLLRLFPARRRRRGQRGFWVMMQALTIGENIRGSKAKSEVLTLFPFFLSQTPRIIIVIFPFSGREGGTRIHPPMALLFFSLPEMCKYVVVKKNGEVAVCLAVLLQL